MRILHIIPTLGGGGAECFVVDLVNELAKEEEVFLCTLYSLTPGTHDFFLNDVSAAVKIISLDKKVGLDLTIYSKIARVLKEVKPDVVNTHLASINYVFPSSILNQKIKFFHTIHSDAQFEIKHPLEFRIRKWMYKKNHIQPITISKQSQHSFRSYYKLDNDVLILNGRKRQSLTSHFDLVKDEIDTYRKTSNTKVLLHIGRFVPVKRQLFLAEVVNDLIQEGKDITLLFVGDYYTSEGSAIANDILRLKNPMIHLLGPKNNVIDYLICADAFCISSDNEGLPMSLLEALSVGCIPISTPVGGIVDVVSEEIGYLADDLSPQAYKRALLKFLQDTKPNEKSMFAENTFNKYFNITSTSKGYLNQYAKA